MRAKRVAGFASKAIRGLCRGSRGRHPVLKTNPTPPCGGVGFLPCGGFGKTPLRASLSTGSPALRAPHARRASGGQGVRVPLHPPRRTSSPSSPHPLRVPSATRAIPGPQRKAFPSSPHPFRERLRSKYSLETLVSVRLADSKYQVHIRNISWVQNIRRRYISYAPSIWDPTLMALASLRVGEYTSVSAAIVVSTRRCQGASGGREGGPSALPRGNVFPLVASPLSSLGRSLRKPSLSVRPLVGVRLKEPPDV